MATINNEELRQLGVEELAAKLRECKEELFNLRFQVATGQMEKSRPSQRCSQRDRSYLHNYSRKRTRNRRSGVSTNNASAEERGFRKTREGIVVSDKMDKTVTVEVMDRVKHGLYSKVLSRSRKLKAHDELNAAGIGDRVKIMETRPISATKRWRVVEILEKAK